jgi:hypothetical protein
MAAQINKALNDGQASPVGHTFLAAGVDTKGVATWFEKTASIAAGWFRLTTSARVPAKPGDPLRFSYKNVMPTVVTETINGVTYQKVIRQMLVTVDVVLPADSTLAERKDLIAYLVNDLGAVGVAGYFGNQIRDLDIIV